MMVSTKFGCHLQTSRGSKPSFSAMWPFSGELDGLDSGNLHRSEIRRMDSFKSGYLWKAGGSSLLIRVGSSWKDGDVDFRR